jgi:hypothetical protein
VVGYLIYRADALAPLEISEGCAIKTKFGRILYSGASVRWLNILELNQKL